MEELVEISGWIKMDDGCWTGKRHTFLAHEEYGSCEIQFLCVNALKTSIKPLEVHYNLISVLLAASL